MTQLKMDKTLRCGLPQKNWVQTQGYRAVRVITLLLTLLTVSAATTAHAQVKLDNTIKKVETFVNEAGEVERRLVDATSVVPGDELQYTVRFTNDGQLPVDAGTIVITDVVPEHTEYLDGTAFGAGTQVWFSVDGETFAAPADLSLVKDGIEVAASAKDYRSIRWSFGPQLDPGDSGYVSFNVRLK
jgi:uncharacterized repeat protein (TIGR01451 family)